MRTIVLIAIGLLAVATFAHAQGDTIQSTVKISICGNAIREQGEHCDGADVNNQTCGGLGFADGSISCSSSCEYVTTSCTTQSNETAAPSFNSSNGGTYTLVDSGNSAQITLPENFYAQDVVVQMFSSNSSVFASSNPAPSGKSFCGKVYDFIFIDENGNTVTALSQATTLVITYTDEDVSGLDETTLAPYRWGDNDSSWQFISGATIDTGNNTVTFSTTQFSSFALFGSVPSRQTSGGGGGVGVGRFIRHLFPFVEQRAGIADLNGDTKVDIVDFSILLYWLEKANPPAHIDLNGDGRVDLVDFSIMAYYWTG